MKMRKMAKAKEQFLAHECNIYISPTPPAAITLHPPCLKVGTTQSGRHCVTVDVSNTSINERKGTF